MAAVLLAAGERETILAPELTHPDSSALMSGIGAGQRHRHPRQNPAHATE
jgi:hypothetical protein